MSTRLRSTIFWIIFLLIVAGIALLIFPRYGRLAKQLTTSQARIFTNNLTASSAANYTQRKANPTLGMAITNCQDIVKLSGSGLPAGFQIVSQAIAPDTVSFCSLTGPNIKKIEFSVIGIN